MKKKTAALSATAPVCFFITLCFDDTGSSAFIVGEIEKSLLDLPKNRYFGLYNINNRIVTDVTKLKKSAQTFLYLFSGFANRKDR